jgi:general secretion pathway protein A
LYQGFYNLKEHPFRLTPDPSFMYMTAQHREALAGLVYSACTRPGLTVLIGEAGTGKTTLLYALAGMLEKRRFITALCTNPMLSREEFYDVLITKLGVECSSTLKSRQLDALQQTLLQNRADGRPSILIVDEAQRLSPDLLEEIRLLLNLETTKEKLLEIVMAGQPELGEILRRPEMRQFKQRISTMCKLKPLSQAELKEYLQHRLRLAGRPEQDLFGDNVIPLIFEYTQGIPRLVNSLCDSALQTGFGLQSARITEAVIEEAARDLELVRTPVLQATAVANRYPQAASAGAGSAPAASPKRAKESPTSISSVARPASPEPEPVPLESYAARQKSLGFFANLIERWK